MRVFFCIFTLLSLLSCKKEGEQLPPIEKTVTLLGRWKEVGPKIAHLDTNGNLIDSVDINSTYEFKSDFTFLCHNDIYLDGVEGNWSYDSNFQIVSLSPIIQEFSSTSEHTWNISELTTDSLRIGHTFKVTLPNQFYYVGGLIRKFYKLY